MAYQKYTALDVWKKARDFTARLYLLTSNFPKEKLYGLSSQLRRCAVSIPSNIAEACGRMHVKETHFLSVTRGSLCELETQLLISKYISMISQEQLDFCLSAVENSGKLINGYMRYLSASEPNKRKT